ncbi:hypothetical protein B0T14DRAFT_567214 [Immersiella caudata]|uniref:C2H2-type domain-containing protein n=1 Tax=Immersiella caudata TaxID=314043 RepID=A0AA39WS47_9PEZI|nr:hypothetical protein B0T14DRAFT_567214 [Immersiella caudata]
MSGQQPDVDPFPCYVDHPGFNHTTTFVFAGQDSPTLAHGYRLDIGELSIDGLGSSPTSEGLSPASQQMFPLSPLSPVAPLGLPQEPVYTEWAFSNTSNIATEVNTGLSLPLHRIGSVPPVRTRELRSRRKGSAKPGPRSQIPKRRLRMERPDLYGEQCEYCQNCFAYAGDLNKHVIAKHYDDLGKTKPTYHCTVGDCSRVYTRGDRLYRHKVAKHGWKKGGNRSSARAVNEGHEN